MYGERFRRHATWPRWIAGRIGVAAGLALLPTADAQDLVITNGIHSFEVLLNTSVELAGRSELHLTDSSAPLVGSSLVDLRSADAWLFLSGLRPSVVVSNSLGDLRVNGAPAVVDRNVRVEAYGLGAVVIPETARFRPLNVYTGPHFTGSLARFEPYTAYSGSTLGTMDRAIRSFTLARGYMATVAQNENGTGISACYVAQDGDLAISVLPPALDGQIRYIRIFPWRWVSKKGIAGNIWQNLNVGWYYNWNLNQNSTRDVEYVPIRQTRWWPNLNQNWDVRGATHLLGFNEPDNAIEANLSVGDAIWSWPDLLATGLRVGAPAVTDGGLSWLYDFMDQADAAGLRVDFVPVHYYRCYSPSDPSGAATQFYNFLTGIHDRVQRPLWITEWNNGANWTGCGDPTFAQQEATVAAILEMLETTPFVERYALYNWVEDVRRVQWDDGWPTDAGVVYRDRASPPAYRQEVPSNQGRGVAQYGFEGDAFDRSGYGNHGFAFKVPSYTAGKSGQAIELDGANPFVQLPANLGGSPRFTFAAWVFWNGGDRWQRIFDFGTGTSQYLFLSPRASDDRFRFAISAGGGWSEQRMETATSLATGQWNHVAVTIERGRGRLFLNGTVVDSAILTLDPSDISPTLNYLGKSQFSADPTFNGRLDEVMILDQALTATQIAALVTNRPPQFIEHPVTGSDALVDQTYTASLGGAAADPDPGQILRFSKVTGPAWLAVAADGTLSGMPGILDDGENFFTVQVTDPAGASAFSVLTIDVGARENQSLLDGSFEIPPTGTFLYNPASGPWTFSGSTGNGSGVTANHSAFTSDNAPAPDGGQVAFLHGASLISQPVSGFIPGAGYTLVFRASQRQNTEGGQPGQTAVARIDNSTIGTVAPLQSDPAYTTYGFPFVATSTDLTLGFRGTNRNGGDNMLFVDDIRLLLNSVPTPPVAITWDSGTPEVTWDTEYIGWRLEVQTALPGTNWMNLPAAVMTNRLPVPAPAGNAYFRLASP